jgi:hypothetical protein
LVAGPLELEGGGSVEGWYALRKAMFDQLRKHTSIPSPVIDAVERFSPRKEVVWVNRAGEVGDVEVEP